MKLRYPILAMQLTLSSAAFASTSESQSIDAFDLGESLGQVITASRIRQNIQDAPATTTIITRTEISELGIRQVPEILRLVPGMVVAQASGNDYRVAYHGGLSSQPRRVHVLIDGISIFRGGLARIDWTSLPITVEDIKRVEVVRNPSSATYGTNSFQAVVNFMTRGVSETSGISVSSSLGSRGHEQWRISAGNLNHQLSLWGIANDGFDKNFQDHSRRDDLDSFGAKYRFSYTPDSSSSFDFGAVAALSDLEVEFADSRQLSFPDKSVDDYYLFVDYRNAVDESSDLRLMASHSLSKIRQKWRSCYETILFSDEVHRLYSANPQHVATLQSGSFPVADNPQEAMLIADVLAEFAVLGADALSLNCGDVNQDIDDTSSRLEAQYTATPFESFRYVVGAGYHYVTLDSDTFIAGNESDDTAYVFSNGDLSLGQFTFNAGFMLEYNQRLNDATDISYRVSANWHLGPSDTIRLAYATATRTPDLFENKRNWGYVARNLDRPIEGSHSALFLGRQTTDNPFDSEEIQSAELAYIRNSSVRGITFQARLFYDELDNLISSRINIQSPPSNEVGGAELNGFELETKLQPSRALSLGAGYAYLDTDADATEELDLAYQHNGFAYARYRASDNATLSLAYYGSDNLSGSSYNKVKLSGTYQFSDSFSADLTMINQNSDNKFTASSGFIVKNNFDEEFAVIVGFKYSK